MFDLLKRANHIVIYSSETASLVYYYDDIHPSLDVLQVIEHHYCPTHIMLTNNEEWMRRLIKEIDEEDVVMMATPQKEAYWNLSE